MATKIIDLSDVVGPPKKVRLQADGPVYKLPADIPAPLYLKVSSYADQEDMSEAEMAEDLYAEMLELFQVHQPDLDELPIGLVALITAVPTIYGSAAVEDEDEGGAPPSRAGTRSTRKKAPAKKPSRSSRS